jgi:carbonic anhydrase/acetyltransferase-like protein (isoleucine patch superfamily)
MIRRNPNGDIPVVHESAFVDPTAILCGKVIVKENVFIGPYAVIRADEVNDDGDMEPIVIGAGSNIQDGVVIHCKAGGGVSIGKDTSIAHRSIVHGPCTVGDHVFVGFNSVLFNCVVGSRSVIRHNSVVEGCEVPAGLLHPLGHGHPLRRRPRPHRTGHAGHGRLFGKRHSGQHGAGERLQAHPQRVLMRGRRRWNP